MTAPVLKNSSATQAVGQSPIPCLAAEGDSHIDRLLASSTVAQLNKAEPVVSATVQLSRPATTLLRRPSGLQNGRAAGGNRGRSQMTESNTAACAARSTLHSNPNPTSSGCSGVTQTSVSFLDAGVAGLRKGSPNSRTRQSHSAVAGTVADPHRSAAQSPVLLQASSNGGTAASPSPPLFAAPQPRAAADRVSSASTTGSPASAAPIISTLPSNTTFSGLSNHLRLSEGLSSLDYHAGFRALAIGSTRQIHVVEVIPMVGHDVAATARYNRSQHHQHSAANQLLSSPCSEQLHSSPASSPAPSPPPPAPTGTAPFLLRNTGVFGGLIKVESVAWYPSTEEASLAFIQPGRTVTIFLDALQFKADGTYLPQQWTRSQYKGKTLNAAMAAGGGSTAMAVVSNLDGGLAGTTPATSTASLGERSGTYTPVSTSLAGGASFSGATISHGGTPHESSLPTPNSGGSHLGLNGLAMSSLPSVNRERKGPAAKELIELNIDITYMRVEKIVWDPHQPYTLALTSPITHFELWQVPTEEALVYGPQLVLRPPAHNTRSVVRDIAFSPSNPHIIVVVTECGNTGQVLLYDRRQVEAMRVFDTSGPGLSAAFHPLFSDLLAVSFRKEKTKPDTRISFLQVMTDNAVHRVASGTSGSVLPSPDAPLAVPEGILLNASAPTSSNERERGSPTMLMNSVPPAAVPGENTSSGGVGGSGDGVPANAYPFLAEQTYLLPIDNYSCVSRMRWRPPSLGRLTEPKCHPYMSFKSSAEELWAARHFGRTGDSEEGDETNWADILHSQLWFASAAVTTDSDLSVWDAANGFFPLCAVKYLGTRADSSTSNEANDFTWINELTLVSIFRNGEVICTSFLNSLMKETLSAGEVDGKSTRPPPRRAPSRAYRARSSGPQTRANGLLQSQKHHRQQFSDAGARDDCEEQQAKTRAEEKACLAMLPAYPLDPYADMFATYIVLPTSSIASDLFGRSFTIRNSNAAMRHHHNVMMRREFGQLLRRLAIQVSREAVLRKQWSEMRYQLPGGGPGSPGVASGLAVRQELRTRRPRSPFTQTINYHGRGTSSQGSDSTPPSPRRSMLARRQSVASSASSFSTRVAQPNLGPAASSPAAAGMYSNNAAATAVMSPRAATTRGTLSSPPPVLASAAAGATATAFIAASSPPAHVWSLDDVNDALLLQASPTGLYEEGDGVSNSAATTITSQSGKPRLMPNSSSASGRTSSTEPGGDIEDGLGGFASAREDETHNGEEEDGEDLGEGATAAQLPRTTAAAEALGNGGAKAWIARLLGFARHERVQRYLASVSESSAAFVTHSSAAAAALSVPPMIDSTDRLKSDEARIEENAGNNLVEASLHHSQPARTAAPARRRQRSQPAPPISVSAIENSEGSAGGPQQLGAAGGSPLQPLDGTVNYNSGECGGGATYAFPSRGRSSAGHFAHRRAGSPVPRSGTSAGSSHPPLNAPTIDIGGLPSLPSLSSQGGVLCRASGGSTNQSNSVIGAPPSLPASPLSASIQGPGSHQNLRSDVVLAKVFPLLKEYVDIGGDRSLRSGRTARSASVPSLSLMRGDSRRGAEDGNQNATVVVKGPCVPSPRSTKSNVSAGLSARKPTFLLPLHPHLDNSNTRGPAQQPPLQQPLNMPVCRTTACDGKSAGTGTVQRTPGRTHSPTAAAASREGSTCTHLITVCAYLDLQRDVTPILESFALSEVVCGWSYTEQQREEFAFVRFALEWDMGYELALSMKALRHDRADAEAAAEAALALETAYAQDPKEKPTSTKIGVLEKEGAQGEQRHCNSNSNQFLRRSHRDILALEKSSPNVADSPAFPTTRPRGRSEGAQGVDGNSRVQHSSTEHNGRFRPLLDWGSGAPAPTHQDVDNSVAAMMEENARICERVMRQQRSSKEYRSAGTSPAPRSLHTHPSHCTEFAVVTCNDEEDNPAMMAAKNSTCNQWNAVGGEASSRFANSSVNVDGELNTIDPRAQWWRAAAHAWRSHHISFILSITTQQLEYAALMGDVQYCLVLYILFCLWWRLHCEVAEAACRATLSSLYEPKYGVATATAAACRGSGKGADEYGRPYSPIQDTDLGAREEGWTSEDNRNRKDGSPRQPYHDSGHLSQPSTRAVEAAERRRGLLRATTPTSINDSCHGETTSAGVHTGMHDCRIARQYGSASVSEDELGNNCNSNTVRHDRARLMEQLEQLHQLRLFFQQCPLMPMQPDTQARSINTATTMTISTGGGPAAVSNANSGGVAMEYGLLGTPGASCVTGGGSRAGLPLSARGGCSGSFGGYLRTSASNQSLPPRSHNSSSRKLNDTPGTPAIASSHRSSTASPGSTVLRPDAKSTSSTKQANDEEIKANATTHPNGNRRLLYNVEGLLGVRLHAQTVEDLCDSSDVCSPEEWKLRALQWLEMYTADLYARQLYVPLNELLLVMPEIFREPTNPVQPRAADIAYEKQMTYVYCGNCSKAELWSRPQQETVPAAVRLYNRVLRRGLHSSSSSSSEEDENESDSDHSVDEEDGNLCDENRKMQELHGDQNQHYRYRNTWGYRNNSTDGEGGVFAGGTTGEAQHLKRNKKKQQQQRQRQRYATRCASNTRGSHEARGSLADSDDSSSIIYTPFVESPTSSSDPDVNEADQKMVAARESDQHASPTNSDVSLSSEHSTRGDNGDKNSDRGSTRKRFNPAAVAAAAASRRESGSSCTSTPGGSRASVQGPHPPPSSCLLSLSDVLPHRKYQQEQQRHPQSPVHHPTHLPQRRMPRLRNGYRRYSLDDNRAYFESSEEHRPVEGEENYDTDHGGPGKCVSSVDSHRYAHRHTAVGCDAAASTANNAVCRRCLNRTAMTCVICEEVVEGMFFWLRGCGHGGHVHHIEEWLRYSQECPKCGTPITATWKGG